MPVEAAPSVNERAFVLDTLASGNRLDGRAHWAYRSIDIQFGKDYGSVTVSLGKTKIFTKISCEVVAPYPDRKYDGVFQISCELSPMVSPAFEAGRPSETETLLIRHLETAIRRSRALDTEALCIVAGHSVFAVRADVHVLSSDGGVLDAACLCVVTALSHFRRPDVSVQGEEVTVHAVTERTPIVLSMRHHPFCTTVSVFSTKDSDEYSVDEHEPENEFAILDATLVESQVASGEVVFTANGNGQICQITKRGGIFLDPNNITSWIEYAVENANKLNSIMKEALEKDNTRRDVGGLIAELKADNER